MQVRFFLLDLDLDLAVAGLVTSLLLIVVVTVLEFYFCTSLPTTRIFNSSKLYFYFRCFDFVAVQHYLILLLFLEVKVNHCSLIQLSVETVLL